MRTGTRGKLAAGCSEGSPYDIIISAVDRTAAWHRTRRPSLSALHLQEDDYYHLLVSYPETTTSSFTTTHVPSRFVDDLSSPPSPKTMHSVRVKRGQYNPLPDVYQGGGQGRPRSRSLATVLGSPKTPALSTASPLTPQFTPQPESSGHARPRSHTTAVPSDRPPLSGPSSPRMTSSKIQTHIMNQSRADSYYHHQHPDVVRGKAPANELTVDGRQRRGEIALEGSAENVVYRGNGDHFGMIGSALSECDGEVDDKHHEDDIVEHLDVIGTPDPVVPPELLTNCFLQTLPSLQCQP